MSTQQLQLVCDSSTLANYKAWAKPISDWLRTLGFTATADTGQKYPDDATSVPGSAAYHYEIFKSPETPYYYIKIMYGNVSGTNCPSLQIGIGTGTDGAGNLNGYFIGPYKTNSSVFTPPSTTTQYECNFSGSGGNRVAVMLWRNGTGNCQQFFAIERSLNSTGSYTSSYVTLYFVGFYSSGSTHVGQRTMHFSYGTSVFIGTPYSDGGAGSGLGGFAIRICTGPGSGSTAFNGSIGFDTPAPYVGFFDYPGTVLGVACGADIAEGVPFTVDNIYGNTIAYLPGKGGPFSSNMTGPAGNGGSTGALCMRYD